MHKQKRLSGFTIVELLIVIVVVAILATISIVAYTGTQNRTYDSIVQSDLANMAKKIELEAADNSGQYVIPSAVTGVKISKHAYSLTYSNLYYCRNTSTNQFAISGRSKSGKQYKYVNGTISEHGSILQSTQTCDLIGQSTPTGNIQYGWDIATQAWRSWLED